MEIRNCKHKLLCKADPNTGMVEIRSSHGVTYHVEISVGDSVEVIKDGIISTVTRTENSFTVDDKN